jgi:cellulose synthase/poly-beta-1,6-N-acetylglucosamine synthase-like glycosyltransferase
LYRYRRCKRNDRPVRHESCKAADFGLSTVTADRRPKFTTSAAILFPLPKGMPLERSLTVLLPVRNVQSTLAVTVQEILEVVSDLAGRFELVIIDDGSTDATSEVAAELTCCYPQVRAVFHTKPLGRDMAIRTGLQQSSGEVIYLRDAGHRGGYRLLDRRTIEQAHGESKPTRPNYLSYFNGVAAGQ